MLKWDYGDYGRRMHVDIRKNAGLEYLSRGLPRRAKAGQVSGRAAQTLLRVSRTMEGKVAVFSHGQFGCVLPPDGLDPVMKALIVLGTVA